MNPNAAIATSIVLLMVLSSGIAAEDASKPVATGEDATATCCEACVKAAASAEANEPERSDTLADLDDVGPLRDQFNADSGHPRAVALLSPVCPGCIESANLIRASVLEKYKEADLKLYVVWLPMVPGDARDKWDPEILNDERATHYWNGSKSIGKWFADHLAACEPLGPVAWDVLYLFGPDSKWEGDQLKAEFCPTPVYRYPDGLASHAEKLLGGR